MYSLYRYQLNSRLEDMIDRLESDWLGPWRGLLLGSPVDSSYQELVREGAAQLREQVKSNHKVKARHKSHFIMFDQWPSFCEDQHFTRLDNPRNLG